MPAELSHQDNTQSHRGMTLVLLGNVVFFSCLIINILLTLSHQMTQKENEAMGSVAYGMAELDAAEKGLVFWVLMVCFAWAPMILAFVKMRAGLRKVSYASDLEVGPWP